MALAIGLTFIILWAISFPLIIGLLLRKGFKDLGKASFISEYGFFYVGLTDEMYYWEVGVGNFRKLVFITLSALLQNKENSIKVSILFIHKF